MKRIYAIICCGLFLVMLGFGAVSLFDKDPTFCAVDNRVLKSFPKVTFLGLLDGSFMDSLIEYYGDTFPNREGLMGSNEILDGFYNFGGEYTPEEAEK